MGILQIWRRIAPPSRAEVVARFEGEIGRLRGEIERLRAENRALLNSILGIAGVPPIPAEIPTSCAEPPLSAHPARRPGPEAPPSGPGTSSGRGLGAGVTGTQVPGALRKRSWQQISRMLEFESGKEAMASDK